MVIFFVPPIRYKSLNKEYLPIPSPDMIHIFLVFYAQSKYIKVITINPMYAELC